jgi:Transposase DDE domain
LVARQDVEPGDTDGTWPIARRTVKDRIVSIFNPESRHVHKTTSNYRDGFKGHLAVEPDTGLISATDLTAGNVGDALAAPDLIADESAGIEALGDSAYGAGKFRRRLNQPAGRPRRIAERIKVIVSIVATASYNGVESRTRW